MGMDQSHPRWQQIRGGHDPAADAVPPKRNQKKLKDPVVQEGRQEEPEEIKPPPDERQVTFQNDLDRRVEMFWVSPQDEESKMMDLNPGQSNGMNTFVGHKFVARSTSGVEGRFTVSRSAADQTFHIGDP